MRFLLFLLGLILGLGFAWWKQRQLNLRLEQVLSLLPDQVDDGASLTSISRLRRGLLHLKQRTKQLEEEVDTWVQQLELAPFGYLLIDAENQLLWCNQKARQWLKLDRWRAGQLRLFLELVRSYELDQLIEQTRSSQQSQSLEWSFQTTVYGQALEPGEARSYTYSVPLRATTIPLAKGEVGIFLENQQQVQQLIQSRDRATSDLAHELRTPLTAIRLVSETLCERLSPPESRWSQQMLQETDRLIHLVQDWLELSQLEQDPHQHLNFETVELHSLITSAWQTLDPFVQQKQLRLNYTGADEVYLEADAVRLTQVFLNLFDNGIKHSPPGSEIKVNVAWQDLGNSPDHQQLQIDVIDAGEGFTEADLPYVFDRLYRGEPSRVRLADGASNSPEHSQKGSGLGLAIVHQIISAHGGTIFARNLPQTKGAWLRIMLPQHSCLN
jgi:two-component system phosphate regulon sensor histidine kinase PhoR